MKMQYLPCRIDHDYGLRMQRLQAFQYELQPDGRQRRDLGRFAGSCRFVFNKALALQNANHAAGNTFIGYVKMANLLPVWKREFPWLGEAPSQALQQALKHLDRAFTSFFHKRSACPRFKKRGYGDSFRFPQGFRLDQTNSRIFLPKLGWLRYRNSREVLGVVKNVTVRHRIGKWRVSIQTEREVEPPVRQGNAVGIDLGVVRFATLSDGTVIPPLNIFKRYAAALGKAQQAMSRKQKFSHNWKKAKARIQGIHVRMANARRDFLHKTSTAISKNHAMVVMEDLQVGQMSRSAAGTVEHPGRNVRQKAGLNRAILDQGWAEFRRQLEYKMLWNGGLFLAVPAPNTSRTCPQCSHASADNRQSQARFRCVECGFAENADLVGAINVLRAGHARLVCEVNGAVSRQQQKPTERAA
jgi:putative transposase